MMKTALRLCLLLGLIAISSTQLLANVVITSPTGGNNIPADKAMNSTNGAAFTALGNIVITEGVKTDFADGTSQTLILTIPDGWRFNAGVGTVTFTSGRNISAASISVGASTATVTFTVSGTPSLDILTIGNLQVQALNGANVPGGEYIRRVFGNAGTAVIAGINEDFTTFGLVNQVVGAAKSLVMHTQPPSAAMAGVAFSPQPKVKVVDQFGTLRDTDSTTVVTAARLGGSGTLQGTLSRTATFGIASYTNLSHNVTGEITIQFTASGLPSVTCSPILVGPGLANRLLFSTQPGSASAGFPFGIQPVVKSQDQFGNNSTAGLPASRNVTVTLTAGTGPLIGTTSLDIGTSAGNGIATFTNLEIDAWGTGKQITAAASGMTNAVSASFGVSAGFFSKLQLLVPGETAAPGTPSGKTGTPSPQAAGTPFNVIVNAVDANWNLIDTIVDIVSVTSSDSNALLPANIALVLGTKTLSVTLNTVGSQTLTASDILDLGKTPNVSPVITVGGGTPKKLKIQTQPSSTGTAGVAFAQQPVVRVEDAGGNLVATDNGRVITVARATGTSTLQGTLTASTVNGIATFANLSYNVAETITLNFTASGLTNAISGNVVISPNTADRLVFTTQPGGASRIGSPLVTQPVLKSRDAFGNLSTVGLPANLNVSLALTSGSGSLLGTTAMDIGTAAGNGVVSYSNLECATAGTNKQFTASASGFTNLVSSAFNIGGVSLATGASAISADTVGGTYTTLTGPAYFQAANTDIGTGTIILNPPAGFIFDAAGTPAPTVLITRIGGTGGNNINNATSGSSAAITSRTTNQITFTVSAAASAGVTCSLIWQNVRVRPSAGTPLASGNLTRTGTATMSGVTASSTSFGTLTEVAGTANRLAFTTQPGSATAGAILGTQPVIRARDQFGNNSTTGLPASKIVTLTMTTGTGPLLGTTSLDIGTATGNALATFTNLEIDSAGTNKQLTATASGFTNAVSTTFTISPATAHHLTVQTQPSATATAGTAFAIQPVVRIVDAFGNLCSSDNSTVVTAARNLGTTTLQGTTSRTAVNGVVTFTNLSYNKAENITLDFSTGSLTGATSSSVAVSPAAASTLTIQTQPSSTATAGTAFAQQPVIRIEDQFGNLRSSDNSTVVTASRNAGTGTLQGTTSRTAVNGLVSFLNLSHNVANEISLAFAGTGLSSANSGTISVSPAAADRLIFTVQPSSTAYGSALSPQPALKSRDAFGNDSTVGIGTSKMVAISVSTGTGTLQGTTSMDIGTGAGNGAVSFSGLTVSAAGTGKQLTASVSGLTSAVSAAFDVTKATVTGSITASNKVYDGNTTATIATRTLSGTVGGDTVSLSGGTASFASKTVGTGKTVAATGLSLTGTDAGNYQLASTNATASADITTRTLAVSATGVNKVYDGTSSATVALSDNRVSGDSLSTTYSSASFADKNVATAKNVSVTGIAVTGTDAANYTANTTTSTTADITARSLVVSATGVNKVYDGSANATVTLADNRVAGDILSTTNTGASFANKNVGTAKSVSVTGIAVTGTDAANYTANTTASTTANITARALSVSASGVNKVYDGNTNASVTLSDNRVAGDSLTASYTSAGFANKNVGAAKTVSVSGISLTGTDAANYTANTTASTTADITARALVVSASGVSKVYNGTSTATVTLSDNRVAGDSLNASHTGASFADKNVGTGKPVSVSGISVTGTDALNYTANTTASTSADITQATATALITANDKIYDGTTASTIATRSLNGVLDSDDTSLSGGTATFASKTAGTAKTVTATGLSLSGTDAANYQLASTTATTTANITARGLLVSATGINKVYDGTTAATATLTDNRVAGDSLSASYTSASFPNKNAGAAKTVTVSGITLSGADAANYNANTTASTTADITARTLTVSAAGVNKVYDSTADATVTLSDNRLAGDVLSTSSTSASFANKNAGTAKTVSVSGITLSGADAANYAANTTASTTANITAKALTVTGITASDKVYSGTTAATVNATGAALVGVLGGDTVTPNTASATGAFADKNVGTGKTVTVSGVTLGGTDAANYSVTQPATTATITKTTLTVIADNKTRTASASNPTLTATYTNFVGGETLATSGVAGSPTLGTTTTNVVGTYPITISAGTLSSGNYNFTFVSGALTVTADAATKLQVLLLGETAAPGTPTGKTGTPIAQTAGSAILNGVIVNAVDANWNLAGSAVPSVTITASDSNATIADDNGGTTGNMTLVSGTRTLSSLTFKTAGTRTITASASGLTSGTSGNVSVNAGAFAKLQLLVPGETAAPGSATGKTGTPAAQASSTELNTTVNAVDANWNVVSTVNDLVGITSSDASATLPANATVLAGTGAFSLSFGTSGTYTVTATDLSDGNKTASTSPAITVSLAQFTPATGGGVIAADGATGTFTTLTGPTYTENTSGNAGTGTIILNAPPGFVFDTGGTAPTVLITRVAGSGKNTENINDVASGTAAAITSRTTTQIVFTVSAPSASGVTCRLTWQNVRVRPTAGTPLASGKLTRSGTANVIGLTISANLGALREVAGAASKLAIQTQPSSTATAGVAFAQQPMLGVLDQFGTLRSTANGVSDSTAVTAARGTGSGALQGTTSRTAVNGLVTFTNLSHNVANAITLSFSGSGLTSTNSSAIAISPAAADRLVFSSQPGSTTYGSLLGTQPVVKTQDPFGNDSTIGLPLNLNLILNLSTGTGSLQGTTSLNIGTAAGSGMAAFSGLSVNAAGTGKQLTASVTGALTSAVSSAFDVAKATVTGSITANSKIYDGTTAATIATGSLTGVLGSDVVTLSGGTASFASKTVGAAKTVTATGLSLSGVDAGNYQLGSTTASATADITAKNLTVTGVTASNKIYDGNTTAVLNTGGATLLGVAGADAVTLNSAGAVATFASPTVGTARTVAVGGLSLSGVDAANYTLSQPGASADITAKPLTVSGITANNKAYDGNTTATLNLGSAALLGVVSGDTVTLNTGSATGAFASKAAGTARIVTLSGLTMSGADVANYTLTQPSASADITAKALTVSGVTASNKVYDGSATATLNLGSAALLGVVSGDTVALSSAGATGTFASKSAGTAKTVTVSGLTMSGADTANYTMTQPTTTADITTRALSVSATASNKVYDGSTSATVTLSDDRVSGDILSRNYSSASFSNKNVGTAKTVSVSGLSISGADAANYSVNNTTSATANITPASVSGTFTADDKVYDGTATATIATRSLSGVLGSDTVSLSGGTASFANKTVGAAKTVTATGLSLSGADAANYQLGSTTATTTADITTRALLVSATGVNKVYDGTTAATATLTDNRVAGDSLSASYTSASFSNKNTGTAKTVTVSGITLSGTDAANYAANTTTSSTADITARTLTVSAAGVNKVYDSTADATVTLSDNRVAGDSLSASYTGASFANKNVGTAKTVTVSAITISGTDAANYTANTTASTIANITAKALTVTGITANDKVYTGTTAATLNAGGATLVGVQAGDTVTPNTASATGAFADKNVGTGKTVNVSGLVLSGADAPNYSVSQPTTTASVTKATLTVIADNKTRTASASNPTLTASYTNFVGGETLASSGVAGSPALNTTTTNVVGTYPISISAGTLNASNYNFTFVDGVLSVTADAATKLLVLLPGETAAPGTPTGKTGTPLDQTAGAAIANGIVVRAVDANWNLAGSAVPNVTITSTDSNAAIADDNGATTGNMTLVSGTRTLSSLTFKTAGTRTITASATGLTSGTSGNVTVNPGAFTKLQLLVPGETVAPGSATGKTGTPSAQIAGVNLNVTVNAVDANWNVVNSVDDVVDLNSSDLSASLPPNADLVAGTGNFTLAFGTNGSFTLTASDSSDGSKTASTSPTITVSPAQFTPATGGGAIAADTATGTFTTLTGPIYTENASGNAGTGTIILNAPAGFVFDTGGTAPTVLITRILGGSAKSTENINDVASGTAAAITSRTSTQIAFTVSAPSASGVTCRLTWQNVRVRPSAGTPLASGNLTRSGTATVVGLPANVNLGALREVAGAASTLAIQTQPSSTATAGMAFAQQPVLLVRDQFGNLRSTANGVTDSTVVTAARGTGSGTLQGTTSRTAVNGLVTFTNLSHNVAGNITITFSGSGLSSTNSSTIAVNPAAADRLMFATQPGSTTYGSVLSAQPVVKTQDPFGNDSSVGLPPNLSLNLNLSTGLGSLTGTTSLDIGTAAGNGTASFAGLKVSMAGTGKQLTASVSSGLTSAVSASFDVAKATVTGSITAGNKVYDGTTAAAIASGSLTGVLGGDTVSLSGGTASFASKSVGTGKAVTATGLSLSGVDAGNYQLASTTATASANITARPLAVSATGVNKAYDGTSSATVTLSDNRVAGDTLSTSYTSASFASKTVGTAKSVNVSGIAVTGTDAANYTANTSTSTTADITARSLVVSAIGVNKVYDGSTNATVTLSDNRVAGDTLSTTFTSASFANKNVGTAKSVNVSGISVSGTDAVNYTANTTTSAAADITARSLSVNATGSNKVYDGTTNATVTLSDDRVAADTLSTSYTSASFANKNVGTAKPVSVNGISITGIDAANYTANTTASTAANITARSLTVSATGVSKVYNGTTTATVTLSDNRVAGDTVTASYTSANFADKNVGTAKPVSVSGISVTGADAANYTVNNTTSTTAAITPATVSAGITANNKVYDGITAATIANRSLSGAIGGDDVILSGGTATFASKNVGTAKTVTATGLSLSGIDTANYQLASSTATTTADITARALLVSASGVNKVYDGTTSATATLTDNRVAGDVLSASYTSASFVNKTVGTGKTVNVSGISISGTDAANYTANTTTSTTAAITARSLTVSATGVNKVYDGSTDTTVTLSDNRFAGDSLSASYTSASFTSKNVGTAKTVNVSGISVSGTDAANYTANTTTTTTANITVKGLTVTGIIANDKVYSATTAATLNAGGATLVGVVSGDTVTPNTGSATGAFSDKNVDTGKTVNVSGVALSGADAANYSVTQPTVTASITKATLTVTADDKTRTSTASNPTLTASYTNFVGGETLASSGVTGSPALSTTTTTAAGTYPISSSAGTLSAGNYNFNCVDGVLTVTAGTATKLQVLLPGETAAPGTPTGKTGTALDQTAGTAIANGIVVNAVDANWNTVSSSTANVTLTAADPNATVADDNGSTTGHITLVSGTRTLSSLTFKTAGSATIIASASGLTAASSANVTINPGAFTKLQLLVPGEIAAPGSATGKTGTPTAQIAGTETIVTVNAVDAQWNRVISITDTVGLTSSDTNAALPANTALLSGTRTLNVTFKTAGTRTLTANDVTDGTKTSNTSPSITVNVGAFLKLQVLVPGETAAPGSVTGKTGTSTSQPAGTAFNVTVNAVDANWNLVNTVTHTVGITSSDSNATLPANGTLTAGTRIASVTLRTAGAQTVTASDITDGTKTANTSSPVTVTAGTATKLTIQAQPSPTATAGVHFVQQPIVRVEDSVGNLVTTDSGRQITATRSAGTGTLQGTVTATTVNGIASFTDLSHNVATTITLNFTASGLTGATSGNMIVSPASASQLVFTTQPSGTRTGSPLATQPVIKTQDNYGNTSSVGLPLNLNLNLNLTSGSGSLLGTTNVDIGTAVGNGTATFTSIQCTDAGAGTNKQITASAAGFANAVSSLFALKGVERATGGTDIPSSTAGGAYTPLTGPVYYEYANGDAGTGTIILNAPAGFVFDTAGTAPTVRIDRLTGSGIDSRNINGVASGTSVAITSRTTTQITFTVSAASSSGVACSLTWQNVRVRPTASSPLASGNITKTGTSTMAAVTNSSTSFGRLIEIESIGGASYNAASITAVGEPASLTEITVETAGIKITFTGSPGYTYQILRAAALQNGATVWEQMGTTITDASGHGEFIDRNPISSQGYYRAVSVGQSQGGLLKY